MSDILIIGGAGYIGAQMAKRLQGTAHKAVVLDNLSSGHRWAVGDAEFIEGDMGDAALLDKLFGTRQFDAVMHFASSILVEESVSDPGKYYDNNVARTVTLLNSMVRHGRMRFIFSSTAAVFGNPKTARINENHPMQPLNPYGQSKHMVEIMLRDYAAAGSLHYGVLRYFNAAGADPEGEMGECHDPETHLIPRVLQAASGRRKSITIFGEDYPTPDGTCVRDYIHIADLAEAHYLLLEYMISGGKEVEFNLGTGQGYSVREVIETARKVTGKEIPVENASRRTGDPATLVADGAKARRVLGWEPRYSDLETIIRHAWGWELSPRRA